MTTDEKPVHSSFNSVGIGIMAATRDNNLILDSVWYINKVSYDKSSSYAFTTYQQEQHGSKTWTGKIGLIELSDVVFSGGWLESKKDGWTLISKDDNYVYSIGERGIVSIKPISLCFWDRPGVYPTLYISSELIVAPETDGSESNPYKLVIK